MVIADDGKMTEMQGGGKAREALRINAYIMKRSTPMTPTDAEWQQLDLAYGGYVIEMGDNAEYKTFGAFQHHIARALLHTAWDQHAHTLAVLYRSGKDTLECGYRTDYAGDWEHKIPTDQCFPYRRVNGQWPYLPPGINRDSTCSQQGTTGMLTKRGATLRTEAGHMGYLLAEPHSGEFIGMNPFPDLTAWSLDLPGGIRVSADGKLGITRVVVAPKERTLTIDHAFRPGETDPARATALLAFGFTAPPAVKLNGTMLTNLASAVIDGNTAYVIPLGEQTAVPIEQLSARFRAAQLLLQAKTIPAP